MAGDRIQAVKAGWVTRLLPPDLPIEWDSPIQPKAGDVLLCEVLEPSLHGRLETPIGGRVKLHPGDRVLCGVGNRYATALLEGVAEVNGDRADLLSASGICGRVVARTDRKARQTTLRILAQAYAGEEPLSLRSFGMSFDSRADEGEDPPWILAVGSAMDSGKTSACAGLINGFARSGRRVGAAKLTGIASARDFCAYRDAGATRVVDLLDLGLESTARFPVEDLERVAHTILNELRRAGVGVGVLEIADGLLQSETAALLNALRPRLAHASVVMTARESLAGAAGVERLARLGYRVTAVSGVVTNSPLSRREVEQATGVPCVRTSELACHGAFRDVATDEARALSPVL